MKSRTTENHNNLVAEVIRQTTLFKPDPAMIKKQIELCIEKDYLERDENSKGVYKYLA